MGLSFNIGRSHGVQHLLLQFGFNYSCLLNVCDWLLIIFVSLWGVTCCHILLFLINTWKVVGIIHFHICAFFQTCQQLHSSNQSLFWILFKLYSIGMYLVPYLILIETRYVLSVEAYQILLVVTFVQWSH